MTYRYGWIGLALLLVLWLPASSEAQTATPASKLGWNQATGTLSEAQALLYEASFNGQPFVPLTLLACTGTVSPYQCEARMPALSSGPQLWVMRAVAFDASNRLESPLSLTFNFNFIPFVAPQAPTNLRIVPGH